MSRVLIEALSRVDMEFWGSGRSWCSFWHRGEDSFISVKVVSGVIRDEGILLFGLHSRKVKININTSLCEFHVKVYTVNAVEL
jgi:hypothetical protein